jgi:hypothetical protein
MEYLQAQSTLEGCRPALSHEMQQALDVVEKAMAFGDTHKDL